MAPLFPKVDLNKLWDDVQNEETLIYAKFDKDLFNISKVIGRKKVAQFFLTHSVYRLTGAPDDPGWPGLPSKLQTICSSYGVCTLL